MIDPRTRAESTLLLLQQDPRRYLSFGPYWYTVKALLKRYYTRDNLALLGDHIDPAVQAAQPRHAGMAEPLTAACAWYSDHQAYGLGRAEFETPDGEVIQLRDPDAAGL